MRRRIVTFSVLLTLALVTLVGPAAAQNQKFTLRPGDAGPQVAVWQHMINLMIAKSHQASKRLAEDGVFGPKTERATRWFERSSDEEPDGVASAEDRVVWLGSFLSSGGAGYPNLSAGVRDPRVGHLQVALNLWIARERLALEQLWIDAIYGPRTEAAVRAFQLNRRLSVDGVVGAQTWSALRRRGLLEFPPSRYPVGISEVARCSPNDFRIVPQGPDGATGAHVLAVRIDPTHPPACRFKGRVRISLNDEDGKLLRIRGNPAWARFSAILDRGRKGPWYNRKAAASWTWRNWCGPYAGDVTWHIEIRHVAKVRRFDTRPRCDAPTGPSRLAAIAPWMHGVLTYSI